MPGPVRDCYICFGDPGCKTKHAQNTRQRTKIAKLHMAYSRHTNISNAQMLSSTSLLTYND
eukprot:5814478-Amphidinium_carterae.1